MIITVDTFAKFVRHQDDDGQDLLWLRYACAVQNQWVPL